MRNPATTRWWMLDPAECIPWPHFMFGAVLLVVALRIPSAWRYIVYGKPP